MICQCGCHVLALDTRQVGEYVRRRRKCDGCGSRFTTYEVSIDRGELALMDLGGVGSGLRIRRVAR